MAFKLRDRVRETTSTTGTADMALAGAVSGHQAFGDVLSDGDTTWYAIVGGTQWETGLGTYDSGGNVL
jgi:hypothetical protein